MKVHVLNLVIAASLAVGCSAVIKDAKTDDKKSQDDQGEKGEGSEDGSKADLTTLAVFRVSEEMDVAVSGDGSESVVDPETTTEDLDQAIADEEKKILEQYDANKNGIIDGQEWVALRAGVKADFLAKYDTNKDGIVDYNERVQVRADIMVKVDAWREAHRELIKERSDDVCLNAEKQAKELGDNLKYYPLLRRLLARCEAKPNETPAPSPSATPAP